MIPNQVGGYSAISARKLLEIAAKCESEMLISEIPRKMTVTFKENFSIKEIIDLMLKHQTRKLLLENSFRFISDRLIIEKIARDLDYLQNIDNFLDLEIGSFKMDNAKIIHEDLRVPEISKIMLGMIHPYTIFQEQVISPWDICTALTTKNFRI